MKLSHHASVRLLYIFFLPTCCLLFLFTNTYADFSAANEEKIILLRHSTGQMIYDGGVESFVADYNSAHGTSFQVSASKKYPSGGNYPYDWWNIIVNGSQNFKTDYVNKYDVISWKSCYPGADVLNESGTPNIASRRKTIGNYKLQFRAIRNKMDQYPNKVFLVWTLTPRPSFKTTPEKARRAREFVDWIRDEWLQEDGKEHPNIFIFDMFGLSTDPNTNCLKQRTDKAGG